MQRFETNVLSMEWERSADTLIVLMYQMPKVESSCQHSIDGSTSRSSYRTETQATRSIETSHSIDAILQFINISKIVLEIQPSNITKICIIFFEEKIKNFETYFAAFTFVLTKTSSYTKFRVGVYLLC
jgi:hypothetical protein